jgi:putative ABC transport system permease protein
VVMLHGALVLADSLRRYSGGDLDLPANVLTAGLRFGAVPGGAVARASILADEVELVASNLPGVMAAGLATALPRHSPPVTLVEVEPLAGLVREAPRPAPVAEVSTGFFATLDATPLVGRLFVPSDEAPGAPPVAVVNVPFVEKFFAGTSPIGRRFRTMDEGVAGRWQEVVGVVPDLGLSVGDPSLAAGYYVPLVQRSGPGRFIYLSMRVAGDPRNYLAPLREALYERDPALVLNRPEPLADVASEDRAFFLWFSRTLIGLGVVTLVLALTGVYAMMSLIVTRRTREIGVRVALGATAQRVVHAVLGRAAAQVALGGTLGAILAVSSLALRSVLVSRLGDGGTWTLPAVLTLLVLAGLAATAVPLRRALRIQPADAMRVE